MNDDIYIYIYIYRVSQEEGTKLRESVPYVKIYRYKQNTYIQSSTVTEIMAREKCGLLVGPRTVPVSFQVSSMFVLESGVRIRKFRSHCLIVGLYQNAISAMLRQCLHSCVMYSAWNP